MMMSSLVGYSFPFPDKEIISTYRKMAMFFSSLPRLFPPKPPPPPFFTGIAITTTSSPPLLSLPYYPPPFCTIPNHSLLFSTLHDSPLTSATLAPLPPHHFHLRLPAPLLPSSQLITPSFLNIQESDNLAPFLLENLLTGEEAGVAAAAAEAVALAKAASDVAKDAALVAGSGTVSIENIGDLRETDLTDLQSEITEDIHEIVSKTSSSSATPENSIPGNGNNPELLVKNAGHQSCPCGEHTVLEMLRLEKVAVRSIRQFERKTKREKAADKASASFIPVKGGYSSRKKRSTVPDIDYTDPLRYLRTTTSTSKLLTASEELELSQGIQDLLKMEKLREELAERIGGLRTFAQWASAAGLDQKKLSKCINYGILCRDKMIKSNIHLVISIAKNYQGAGMNLQDLVQEGCQGLVRGAEKFDASKGFKFSTYAHWWIKQAVRKSLSDQSRTIQLPFHMVEATYLVREARKQLYRETGRHPDNEEVAEATGLSMKRLTAVLLTPKAPRSLDQKIGINQNLKPSEVIADPEAETAEEALMKQFMKSDLNKILDRLNPREKQVIRWRFGLEDGRMKTLQEIGELIGVSRERIRQIESCAFRKLKNKKIN